MVIGRVRACRDFDAPQERIVGDGYVLAGHEEGRDPGALDSAVEDRLECVGEGVGIDIDLHRASVVYPVESGIGISLSQ